MPPIAQDDHRPNLRPPQLRLRTLFLLVGLIGTILAAARSVGPYPTAIIILFAFAVIAHVAGNAIGTRLRQCGDTPIDEHGRPFRLGNWNRRNIKAEDYAPTTQLSKRRPLGLPLLVSTVTGAVGGTVVGIYLLWIDTWPELDFLTAVLGLLGCAVLGGIWSFVSAGFIQVSTTTIWQATRDSKPRPSVVKPTSQINGPL